MDTQPSMWPVRMDTTRSATNHRGLVKSWATHSSSFSPLLSLSVQCVVQLLDHGADFNKTSLNGGNPLYFACKSDNLHYMYNVVVDDAVMLSCRHGQVKCLHILLEKGAVVVSDRAGVSPLQLCAEVNCKCQIQITTSY